MKGDAPRAVPTAPEMMSDGGRKVWERLAPDMVRFGRLEPHHADMFAVYCEAVADFIELTSNITLVGRTYEVETRNGKQQKKTADWQARLDAVTIMRQVGAVFGMSPVDDQRLSADGQGDLFDAIMDKLNAAPD